MEEKVRDWTTRCCCYCYCCSLSKASNIQSAPSQYQRGRSQLWTSQQLWFPLVVVVVVVVLVRGAKRKREIPGRDIAFNSILVSVVWWQYAKWVWALPRALQTTTTTALPFIIYIVQGEAAE